MSQWVEQHTHSDAPNIALELHSNEQFSDIYSHAILHILIL